LTLGADNEFISKLSATVIFTTEPGKPLAGLTLKLPPLKFNSEAYRAYYYPSGSSAIARGLLAVHLHAEGLPTEMISENFSGRLEFFKVNGDTVDGQLVLVFSDRRKSYLTGQFRAKMTKLDP
jgi:hypothetical protein